MQMGMHGNDSFSNWVAAEARILKQDNMRINAADLYLLRSFQAVLARQLVANPVPTNNPAMLLSAVPGSLGRAPVPQVRKQAARSEGARTSEGSQPIKTSGLELSEQVKRQSHGDPVVNGFECIVGTNGKSSNVNTTTQEESVSVKNASACGWLSPNDAEVCSTITLFVVAVAVACTLQYVLKAA
jgi:hypothetical protein